MMRLFGKHPAKYKEGLALYRAKQWGNAASCFQESIKSHPNHSDSLFKLGMCLFRLEDFAGSVKMISDAIALNPERSEWNKQLTRAQEKLEDSDKKRIDDDGSISAPTTGLVGLAQNLVLSANYDSYDRLLQDYSLYNTSRYAIGCKEGEFLKFEVDLIRDPEKLNKITEGESRAFPESRFFAGKYAAYFGDYRSAEKHLSFCVNEKIGFPDNVFILANVLSQLAKPEDAFHVLASASKDTRRAMLWKCFSTVMALNTGKFYQFSEVLKAWLTKSPNALYNPDITKSIALSYLYCGQDALARKLWHDCIEHNYLKKPGYTLPDSPRYSQRESLPLWLKGFWGVRRISLENITSRARHAILELGRCSQKLNIEIYPLHKTKSWLAANAQEAFQEPYLEVAIDYDQIGQPSLDALIKSGGFILFEDLRGVEGFQEFGLKHINGVYIRCLLLQGNEHELLDKGVSVKLDLPALVRVTTCIDNIHFYTGNSGADSYNEIASDLDLIEYISNAEVVYPSVTVCYLYEKLFDALANDDQRLEASARWLLRELGEGEESYQQVLAQNYMLATEKFLRKENIEVILYVTGLENVAYQGNMWIPVLEKLKSKCAIVIREKGVAADLIPSKIPVFYMKTMRDLELLDNGVVKTILYPANTQKNVQTLRFHKITHCFINHGESDKVVNQSKFLMAYDYLLVAGPLAERRLKSSGLPLRDGQVIHVGRPQVELSLSRVSKPTAKVRKILYAPTWEGFVEEANYSSVNANGLAMLKTLSQICDLEVYFKPHPYTGYNKNGSAGKYLNEMRRVVEQFSHMHYINGNENIHNWMNASDLLITDISSVLNDYLYTLKPIVLIGVGLDLEVDIHHTYPSSKAAYILEFGNEVDKLLSRIENNDELYNVRLDVSRDSLGEFPEGSLKRFSEIVSRAL